MKREGVHIILIGLLAVFAFSLNVLVAQPADFYERGIKQRDRGNWQRALQIWQVARDSLWEQDRSDPRIGIAFIELATQKQATAYYEDACRMYFWGFSNYDMQEFSAAVKSELERIFPILGEKESSVWLRLLKKGDPLLHRKMKAFWTMRDPIPTSETNERLIEHWERIAYSKQKFRLASTTIYGTDDRGLVFVKYGAPDDSYAGELGTSQQEIMRWFDDFAIRQEIQRFNRLPRFELWVYRGLGNKESTIFLFGKRGGLTKFGLRNGVEDLISERAFSRRSTKTTRGVLPGAVLQLMYYSELMTLDNFYLNRYRELEELWVNARAGGQLSPDYDFLKGKLSSYRSKDRATKEFKYIALERTDALEGLEPLQLKVKRFRWLDEFNEPRIYLMAVSASRDYDDLDFTPFFRKARKTKLKNRHILISYDENWDSIEKRIKYGALSDINTALFDIPYDPKVRHYTLVAEKTLLETRKAEIEEADIPDTAKVIGIGTVFLDEMAPLRSHSSTFEVSDLILGIATPPHVDRSDYPFPVIPKDPVRRSESLKLYLEVYDLRPQPDEKTTLSLEYEIRRLKRRGKVDESKERLSGRLSLDVQRRSASKTFPIDLRGLIPGDYRLTLKSVNSNQNMIRNTSFRIIG